MSSDTPEVLLQRIHEGKLAAVELTGEQFQAILFYKLIEICRREGAFEYELLDNYHGAVDFVLREKSRAVSPFQGDDPVHLFECKYYRRTLELNAVAKLLVVGVRFQPASVNVVSKTALQPQVYDYARVFSNGLGNDAPMFRRTLFRHYLTSELLDLEVDEDPRDSSSGSSDIRSKRESDIAWDLVECRPFAPAVIAESSSVQKVIGLDGRWNCRLNVSVFSPRIPTGVNVWIDGLPKDVELQSSEPRTDQLNGGWFVRWNVLLDLRLLDKVTKASLVVHVVFSSQMHRVLTIPVLMTPHDGRGQGHLNLREAQMQELATGLRTRSAPRLLFLCGSAGVGKTHLIEGIAEDIQSLEDFGVYRFTADLGLEPSLLKTMFVSVCTPATAQAKDRDVWHELAASILKALSPVVEGSEPRLRDQPTEVIIPVLAEILVRSGPRLIVIRDAHQLSEVAAREIGALIKRLDDLGWGDVFCVFEYRTLEAQNNRHWRRMELDLRNRVNRSLVRQLEPLSKREVDTFLDDRFESITEELKTALWDACGGIPLYLFSVLAVLDQEVHATIRSDNRKWVIRSPSAFLVSRLAHDRAEAVLQDRLRTISWKGTKLCKPFNENPLLLVALVAIARDSGRIRTLFRLAGVSSIVARSLRRTLMRNGILRPSANEWEFDFEHELLRQAALDVGQAGDRRQPVIEMVLTRGSGSEATASDLELCADLASWAGFHDDARRALNAAFERARGMADFTLIYRILRELRKGLEMVAFESPKQYLECLNCRSEFAWATWNTGSFVEAREEYRLIAADVRDGPVDLIDPRTAEVLAADAQRRVVGLDLHLEDFSRFAESAQTALELEGHSVAFHSVMNRLVLYCAKMSHVDLALEFASATRRVFGDPDLESAGAVICSDLGALYRTTDADGALLLYRQGTQLATGPRQRLYSQLDVFITQALAGWNDIPEKQIDDWRGILIAHGLRSMLARFDLFRAARALHAKRLTDARKLYEHVETSVAVYRYDDLRLPLLNDRLLLSLIAGDDAGAARLLTAVVTHLKRALDQRKAIFATIAGLRPMIERQALRFSELRPLEIQMPLSRPAYSGATMQILLNLESLSTVVRGELGQYLSESVVLWPEDVDRALARTQFAKCRSMIECRGVHVASCAE